jgi:hypothetical protein
MTFTFRCILGENVERISVSESYFLQHCSTEGTGFEVTNMKEDKRKV